MAGHITNVGRNEQVQGWARRTVGAGAISVNAPVRAMLLQRR